MSITAALREFARRQPEAAAVSFSDSSTSWAGLDALVDRAAAYITATVPEKAGVALALPNCPAFIVLFLAIARAGDPQWPQETMQKTIVDLRPALLVTATQDSTLSIQTLTIDPGTPFPDIPRLFPDYETTVEEPDELAPFYVGFTSGSTGLPKGYRRHHRSWLRSFAGDQKEFGLTGSDTILALGSFTHSLFLYALIKGLNAGVHVIVYRAFQAAAIQRLLQHEAATVIYAVPSQLLLLADAANRTGISHEKIRLILSGGAKWQAGDKRQITEVFPAAEFIEFYGASELSFITIAKDSENAPPASVGRPFADVRITIRDPDGTLLPQGSIGLVFVESELRFIGYATTSRSTLRQSGNAISVGDIGYFDKNNYLYLVGRADRMINCSGKKIYPEEIEAALLGHSAVRAAAVFGIADQRRGQMLVAVIAADLASGISRSGLVQHLRTTLSSYKIPKQIGLIIQWPLTASGKTDYAEIERQWQAGKVELLT
jgi:Acyl-CoA synthetases (AMP-forming)/AMP-acid ligases II